MSKQTNTTTLLPLPLDLTHRPHEPIEPLRRRLRFVVRHAGHDAHEGVTELADMRTLFATGTLIILSLTACGGDGDEAASCAELWVDGADLTDIEEQACIDDSGDLTVFGWASFECTDGAELRMNDFGHWRTDDMILITDWTSGSDYTIDQLNAICPQA